MKVSGAAPYFCKVNWFLSFVCTRFQRKKSFLLSQSLKYSKIKIEGSNDRLHLSKFNNSFYHSFVRKKFVYASRFSKYNNIKLRADPHLSELKIYFFNSFLFCLSLSVKKKNQLITRGFRNIAKAMLGS